MRPTAGVHVARTRTGGVGLAPPLLAVFILMAAGQQWASFWYAREALTMRPDILLVSLGMALPYIFVSQAMSPADDSDGGFGRYYMDHRGTLLGALAVPPVVSFVFNVALTGIGDPVDFALWLGLSILPRALIPILLIFVRSPTIQAVGLSVLILHTVWLLFL